MMGKWSIFEENSLYITHIYIYLMICIYSIYLCTIYSEHDKTAKSCKVYVRMEYAAYNAAYMYSVYMYYMIVALAPN